MDYRLIDTAPESVIVSVVWGQKRGRPQYGQAKRLGNKWFIYGELNPYANGLSCAAPDGWLPEDSRDWTEEERMRCNELARGLSATL